MVLFPERSKSNTSPDFVLKSTKRLQNNISLIVLNTTLKFATKKSAVIYFVMLTNDILITVHFCAPDMHRCNTFIIQTWWETQFVLTISIEGMRRYELIFYLQKLGLCYKIG